MGLVRTVGQVFFPLDEELALRPGRLTPKHQEHLVHLASWMPFARAAQMLERLLGVQVSEPTVRRGTEHAGALYEALQTAQSQLSVASSPAVTRCARQVISADGAYVPLLGGEWAEVRTVAIGEVKRQPKAAGEDVQTCQISYFSRMSDAETFADLAEVEMRRRAVNQAEAVGAITDGAPWLQRFIDLHCNDAVRILDFPHAAEHLGLLVEALTQAQVSLPPGVVERSLHVLKYRGAGLLMRWGEHLPEALKTQEAVHKHLEYFRKRLHLMHYPDYRRQGWPIGSGMVESANKVVVQARLKGAGMHWQPRHVNAMLTLRTAVCSERWEEGWQEILQASAAQRASTRRERATTRFEALLSSFLLLLLRFRPPTPKPQPSVLSPVPRSKEPAATLPGSFRPSASHPWKRSPSCRPSSTAKK
jgi:hypothetical protein